MPLETEHGTDQLAVPSLAASFVSDTIILLQMDRDVVPDRPPGVSLPREPGMYAWLFVCDRACAWKYSPAQENGVGRAILECI